MNNILRSIVLFISGFLTILLLHVLPEASGGKLMIVFITVPFLIGLGFILAIGYMLLSAKQKSKIANDRVFFIMLLTLIFLSFLLFPYA